MVQVNRDCLQHLSNLEVQEDHRVLVARVVLVSHYVLVGQ